VPRFAVYPNPLPAERRATPYFVDVQNDYIDHLDTRVVIPLRKEAAFGPRARDLNPLLEVLGEPVVLDAAAIGAVPRAELRRPVADLHDARDRIQDALDALFGAY
jgi:toxin CcdB